MTSPVTPHLSSSLGRRLLAAACLFGAAAAFAATNFDFQELEYRARTLSSRPYEPQTGRVPDWLLPPAIRYDQHRDIRFRPERALWRDESLPFQIQFFHPGWLFKETVQVYELDHRREFPVAFDRRLFDYGKNKFDQAIPRDMGFAGFRIHCALNRPEYFDELAVFLGASYFRALGQDMHYGLSARGLAIDTAEPGGEEFPVFREFWIERPTPGAKQIVVYALMDSRRLTGAYRFTITPGKDTVMRVKATLFLREPVKILGLAPFSSMFWHGENSGTVNDDYRPEVHDSDGLLIHHSSGEWLWRPLDNPKAIRVAQFNSENPRGFGLLQRDRDFDHYQDLEASYQQRPSVWVEPLGDWGRGAVRLVEFPTPDETMDNVVACWVPEKCPEPGQPFEFEYDLHWLMDMGRRPPGSCVVATRTSGVMGHPELRRFVVDFDGIAMKVNSTGVEGVVTLGEGASLEGVVTQKNNINGTWRLAFEIKPDGGGRPVELRAFLRKGDNVLTETWSYLWQP